MLGLLLLLLKLSQLSLSLLYFLFRFIDMVVLCVQIIHELLVVNDMLRPIYEIGGTRGIRIRNVVLSFDGINLVLSVVKGLLRDSLLGAQFIESLGNSFRVVFSINLLEHIFRFLPALINRLSIVVQSLNNSEGVS